MKNETQKLLDVISESFEWWTKQKAMNISIPTKYGIPKI